MCQILLNLICENLWENEYENIPTNDILEIILAQQLKNSPALLKTRYWFVGEIGIECYSLVFCHSKAQPKPNDFHLKTFSVTGIYHSLFTASLISEHWNLREKSRLCWNHADFNASPILETLAHYFHPNIEFQWLGKSLPEPKVRKD